MQSAPEYQQHFSEILLKWSSALRSNTFTTVQAHLGPECMEKHYETCGETLSFDMFFLSALSASRQPDDSKEHIFIKQWPLEDAKNKSCHKGILIRATSSYHMPSLNSCHLALHDVCAGKSLIQFKLLALVLRYLQSFKMYTPVRLLWTALHPLPTWGLPAWPCPGASCLFSFGRMDCQNKLTLHKYSN